MRITLIGAGNVGTQLGRAFPLAGHTIVQVFSRSAERAGLLAETTGGRAVTSLDALSDDAEVVIFTVHDDAISQVYHAVRGRFHHALLLHTAGSVGIDVFAGHARCGVMWPVQSLSATHDTSMRDVPFAISGNTRDSLATIEALARSISDLVYPIDDRQREYLHLAATFANNFSNHMYAIAKDLTDAHDIPFDILKPLILGTAQKVQHMTPDEAQTGPAARGDKGTLLRHLMLMKDRPDLQEIYHALTRSIVDSGAKDEDEKIG